MTAPAAATAPDAYGDVIKDLIKSIQSADNSDSDAIKRLSDMTDADTASEEASAPATDPDALTVDSRIIIRPNGTEYHVRKLEGHDDIAVLRAARENKIYPLLTGLPGTGKTAVIEAAYGESAEQVYTVQGTGDTVTDDFIGSWTQLAAGEYEWVDGPLIRAMENGKTIYIDEIALIDPKVLALVYGVMDGRDELRITQNPDRGVVKAKPGFHVAAACNPNAPGARMSEALVSRFTLQYEVTTDYDLARKLGVPNEIIRASSNLATKLRKGEIGWAPQFRELIAYRDAVKVFGRKFALRNLVAQAPELDRVVVKDILSRELGSGELIVELKTQ